MKTLTKDAHEFVAGVVTYLRHEGKAPTDTTRVENLLHRVTASAKRQRQAVVESSVKLTAGEKLAVGRVLAQLVGHPVTLICRKQPDLVGGLRIKMADWVVDTSLTGQLSQMAQLLS